jgi:hypothetical protein
MRGPCALRGGRATILGPAAERDAEGVVEVEEGTAGRRDNGGSGARGPAAVAPAPEGEKHDDVKAVAVRVRGLVPDPTWIDHFLIDRRRTVITALAGEEAAARYKLLFKRRAVRIVLQIGWAASLLLCTLVCCGAVRHELGWLAALVGMPGIVHFLLRLQVDLLFRSSQTFDSLYLMMLLLCSVVAFADLCEWDGRSVSGMFFGLLGWLMCLVDASGMKRSQLHYTIVFSVVMPPVVIMAIAFLGGYGSLSPRTVVIASLHEPVLLNNMSVFLQAFFLVWVFMLRFLTQFHQDPNTLLFIKPRMRSIKIDLDDISAYYPRTFRSFATAGRAAGATGAAGALDRDRTLPPELHCLSESDLVWVLRMAPRWEGVQVIDSRTTMASKLFGRRIADGLFEANKSVVPVFMMLWCLAMVIGLLTWTDTVERRWCWVGWLSAPLLMTGFVFASPVLMARLVSTFDACYLTIMGLIYAAAMYSVFPDCRASMTTTAWWSFITSVAFDAFHSTARNYNAQGAVAGAAWIVVVYCIHQFGTFADPAVRDYRFKVGDLEFKDSNLMFAQQRSLTILGFLLRNAYFAYQKPGFFVMLRGRLELRLITVADAKAGIARAHRRMTGVASVAQASLAVLPG